MKWRKEIHCLPLWQAQSWPSLMLQVLEKFENPHYVSTAVFLSTSLWKSCDVTVAFTFCLFKYSQRCLERLMSDDCEEKAMRVSTLCSCSGLQTDLAQRYCMFRAIVLLGNESLSTLFPPWRDGMPLKNGVVLLFGQCVVHLMHVTSSWEGKTWIFPPSNLTVCFMPLY